MTSSRKRQATRKNKRRNQSWGQYLLVAAIGLGLAGIITAVFLYHGWRSHNKAHRAVVTAAGKPDHGEHKNRKAAEPDKEKPHYDFYTMLPNLKVFVPETGSDSGGAIPPEEGDPLSSPGTYTLQVGSYRNLSDADRVKARLALLGIEADIYTVKVSEETWHRVVVGPYSNGNKLRRITTRLRKNNIEFMVTKIRG
jgi:cell division protein FtsN